MVGAPPGMINQVMPGGRRSPVAGFLGPVI
jgi:hypothetical protein